MKFATFGKILLGIGGVIGAVAGGVYLKGKMDALQEIHEMENDDIDRESDVDPDTMNQLLMARAFDDIASDFVKSGNTAMVKDENIFDSKNFRKSAKKMLKLLTAFDNYSVTGEFSDEEREMLKKYSKSVYSDLKANDTDESTEHDNVVPLHKEDAIKQAQDQEILNTDE